MPSGKKRPPNKRRFRTAGSTTSKNVKSHLRRPIATPTRKRTQGAACSHVSQMLLDKGEENYRELMELFVIPSSKCLIPWDPKQSRGKFCCQFDDCSDAFQFACGHCKAKTCRTHAKSHAVEFHHGCSVNVEFGFVCCFLCEDVLVQMEKLAKLWRDHRLKSVYETALRHGWLTDLKELEVFLPKELRESCEKRHALVGVHGIVNLSNTCCLNVILQALCHTPLFRDFCLARLHRCNPSDLRFNHNCVMCAFSSMIFDLYILPPGQCYAPSLIFQAVQNSLVDHGSELGEQEDPAEIINLLLNDMHLQAERDGRKINSSLCDKLHLSDRELASHCVAHGIYCSCIVCDLFSGIEEYTTTCLNCKQDRVQGNSFKLLMLPIGNDKSSENGSSTDLLLEDCLKIYTDPQLTSEVKNDCCLDVKGAYRTNKFRHLPVVLIIQLKRAVAKVVKARISVDDLKKNKEHIQFPLSLDMAPYMAEGHTGSTRYVLYGVIVHKGVKLSSGHYVCYIKHMSGRWLCMDDRAVFCFSESHVLSLQAYMLFYILESVEFTIGADIPPPIPPQLVINPPATSFTPEESLIMSANDISMPPPLKIHGEQEDIQVEDPPTKFSEVPVNYFPVDHDYGRLYPEEYYSDKNDDYSDDDEGEELIDECNGEIGNENADLHHVSKEKNDLMDLLYGDVGS